MNNYRFTHIDIAKAICIIFVVIGHAGYNQPQWYENFKDWIYSFHMPTFMFLSGFLYSGVSLNINYKELIIKKIKRLIIPYISVSILIILIKLSTSKILFIENQVSLFSIFEIFYKPSAGFFLWFIYTLFLIFLITGLFNTVHKKTLLFLFSIIVYLLPIEFPEIFCLSQIKTYLFFFTLGMFCFDWNIIQDYILKMKVEILIILFLGFYFLTKLDLYNNFFFFKTMNAITSIIGIFSVISLSFYISLKRTKIKNILLKVANYSFSIYLFHTTFSGLGKAAFLKIEFFNFFGENLFFIISVLFSIILGVGFPILLEKYIIRKNKILCFLFGIKLQNTSKNFDIKKI